MKSKIFLAFAFSLFGLVWLLYSISAAPTVNDFVPILLSDKTQTTPGDLTGIHSLATENAVHLIWSESTTTTHPYDLDLFYRRLPGGTTIDLSKTVPTNGHVSDAVIQPTTGDDVCILWREIDPNDEYRLYLWRSATNAISISPGIVKKGTHDYLFELPEFYCDNAGNARIGWVDPVDNQVIYWDEASGTQVQISDNNGTDAEYFDQVNIDGVTYLLWSQDGYYMWDSNSENKERIIDSSIHPKIYVDKDDRLHIFWLFTPSIGPGCNRHWDSFSQVITNIEPCDVEFFAIKDGEGNIQAGWGGGSFSLNSIHYWNVTQNVTATISTSGNIDNLQVAGGPDDTAHIVWQNSSNGDLFYSTSKVLVERFVTKASYNILPNNTVWDFDSSGNIHFIWGDIPSISDSKHVVYWQPMLTDPITLTNSTLFAPAVDIYVDAQDTTHALAYSQSTLYYWNEQMNHLQTIVGGVKNYLLTVDADGEAFIFFQTYLDELFYWSAETGSETQLGYSKEFGSLHNSSGWLYLYWIEEGSYPEEDMYIISKDPNAPRYTLFLPTIIKP